MIIRYLDPQGQSRSGWFTKDIESPLQFVFGATLQDPKYQGWLNPKYGTTRDSREGDPPACYDDAIFFRNSRILPIDSIVVPFGGYLLQDPNYIYLVKPKRNCNGDYRYALNPKLYIQAFAREGPFSRESHMSHVGTRPTLDQHQLHHRLTSMKP